jgi:voltage-gated potassium channel
MKNISQGVVHFCRKAFYDSNSNLFVLVHDFLSVAIILSIIAIILESVSQLSQFNHIFLSVEYIAVALFSLEYIGRIIGSQKKLSYIFSFFGLIDLISILPTLLQLTNLTPLKSLRALRILRFLRMVRLAKVVRFEHLERHSKDDRAAIIKLNLQIYFWTLVFTVTILGTLMYIFEEGNPRFESIPLSMLWTLENLFDGSISGVTPQSYAGIATFIAARFISYILLGFLIHIIGTLISHVLLGKKTSRPVEEED